MPASLAAAIDWEQTYVNCFTAGPLGVRRARLPMVLPDEAVVHPSRAGDVRKGSRRAEAGAAHPVDGAPDAVLGQPALLAELPAAARTVDGP